MPELQHAWSERYRDGNTPWDLGRAHPELVERLAELGEPGRAYVPGCGRGWDAVELAGAGWSVTAVDVVPELAPHVGEALAAHEGRFVVGDALAFADEQAFDLLFEHTFCCAIPPAARPEYGAMAGRLVRPGGRLAAVVFPIGRPAEAGGPPYGIATADLVEALGPAFRLLADELPRQPVARRPWPERWALFERLG